MTKPKVKPKKADKSKDSSAPGSSTDMKGTPATASPDVSTGGSQQASAPTKSATRVNFTVEIQSMISLNPGKWGKIKKERFNRAVHQPHSLPISDYQEVNDLGTIPHPFVSPSSLGSADHEDDLEAVY